MYVRSQEKYVVEAARRHGVLRQSERTEGRASSRPTRRPRREHIRTPTLLLITVPPSGRRPAPPTSPRRRIRPAEPRAAKHQERPVDHRDPAGLPRARPVDAEQHHRDGLAAERADVRRDARDQRGDVSVQEEQSGGVRGGVSVRDGDVPAAGGGAE